MAVRLRCEAPGFNHLKPFAYRVLFTGQLFATQARLLYNQQLSKNLLPSTMNHNWKNFLLSQKATFESDTHITFPPNSDYNGKTIYPVAHLAVLTIRDK
jgi:hypothetical protein